MEQLLRKSVSLWEKFDPHNHSCYRYWTSTKTSECDWFYCCLSLYVPLCAALRAFLSDENCKNLTPPGMRHLNATLFSKHHSPWNRRAWRFLEQLLHAACESLSSCFSLTVTSHLEEERVGVVPQLAQQSGLYLGVDSLFAVLQRRVHLAGGQVQLPAKGNAHHVHVVSAVPEGAGQGDKHWRGQTPWWSGVP